MTNSDRYSEIPRITPPVHVFTYDEERVEHIISDEALMQIVAGGKDVSLQIAIAGLGIAFGYFQNFWATAGSVLSSSPVGPWDGVGALVFVSSATLGVVAAISHRSRSTSINDLLDGIRSRKVGVMAERPYEAGEPFQGDSSVPIGASSTTE